MKKLLFFVLVGTITLNSALAHNPLSAMYYFEVEDDLGILNISVSQLGFHEALVRNYSETDLDKLSDIEYKQLAVAYIKNNFYLRINGVEVVLLNGGLKLGNHQTDLKFITAKLPGTFENLDVKIEAMKENGNHQTVFSFARNGLTDKVILSKNNQFSTSVIFKDNKMIADNGKFNPKYLWFAALVPIYLVAERFKNGILS